MIELSYALITHILCNSKHVNFYNNYLSLVPQCSNKNGMVHYVLKVSMLSEKSMQNFMTLEYTY